MFLAAGGTELRTPLTEGKEVLEGRARRCKEESESEVGKQRLLEKGKAQSWRGEEKEGEESCDGKGGR